MVHPLSSPLADTPSARDYIDIMCEIRKLSIYHEFEHNTPTIVVFGDQSSGKSSVLQRLTGGLPMPRGSNKCTATPFEIRMLQTERPLRTISLRVVEDRHRRPTMPRELDFADITHMDAAEIETKLRQAQRFVQNPSVLNLDEPQLPDPDSDELAFTKNAVCVTISGPDQMYSLSMVDLPGIVRNNTNHEQFVLSLVKEYIRKDTAILVPIFQATSDIATQCAWLLARDADPAGSRTVGVLTKMDRVDPNDDEKHLELATLVKGDRGEHQIENGTYVIRNPSSSQSRSSELHEDPNELEQATIRSLKQHKVWRKVEVPENRFGLQNLTMKLSELQGKAHEKSWPKIRPFLEQRRLKFWEKLKALPLPPTGNPTIRFMELIGKFDKIFTSHAHAEHVDHRLYRGQQWNFGQFDQALLNTRPRYLLAFGGDSATKMFDPIKPGALQCRGWPKSITDEIIADPWGERDTLDERYEWNVERLCKIVQASQGGQMVGYFPFKSVVAIVKQHQEEWFQISTILLNKNHDWVGHFVNELVDDTFKEFPNAVDEIGRVLRDLLKQCKEETWNHLRDLEEMEHMSASRSLYVTDEASLLKKQSKYFAKFRILSATKKGDQDLKPILKAASRLCEMMQDEDADDDEFEQLKNELIHHIIENRETSDASEKLLEEVRNARLTPGETPSTATSSMMMAVKNAYLEKLIGVTPRSEEDSMNRTVLKSTISEHAFLAATGALAYWKMAHNKFREVVPRIVEFYLVHQFAMRLGMHLRTYFKLTGLDDKQFENSDLKDILGENPENARNRKEWQESIDALSVIIDKVRRASSKNRNRKTGGGGSSRRR